MMYEKPISDVFKFGADFNLVKIWSPWMCLEPSCIINLSGTPMAPGHKMEWDGEVIGAGEMTISKIEQNKRIDFDLLFLKPYKSLAKVEQIFAESNGKTTVHWNVQSELPFFLFFLKKMMTAYIGNDFRRGLLMMKSLAEKGKIPSRIEPKGVVPRSGFHTLGLSNKCHISEVGPVMRRDFEKMHPMNMPRPLFAFAIYHTFDMVSGECHYTCGLAYDSGQSMSGLVTGYVADHQALQVDHFGLYEFLGNGWSAVFGRQRSKKLKVNKKVDMYEIYKTMPGQVTDEQIHTELFLPVR